jgi:UPF0716 protein FxsA
VTRALFLLLLVSLIMLVDGYVLIVISRTLGIYLLLAIEAATGLIGVLFIIGSYRHGLDRMREAVRAGRYPGREFRWLACLIVSALCLIMPGFVSDALGILVVVPPLRWVVGYAALRAGRGGLDELYEYLKLEE